MLWVSVRLSGRVGERRREKVGLGPSGWRLCLCDRRDAIAPMLCVRYGCWCHGSSTLVGGNLEFMFPSVVEGFC